MHDLIDIPPSTYDFWLRLSRTGRNPELLPDHDRVNIRGRNYDMSTGTTPEDLWGGSTVGGGLYTFPTGLTSVEIVSTNTNDTAAGTGARIVRISGLDRQLNPISASGSLNGTSAVAIGRQFYRINNFAVTHAGSGLTNAGQISVRASGGGTVYGVIPIGAGIASHAIYTVRRGWTGYIVGSLFSIERQSSQATAEISLFTRVSNVSTSPWIRRWNFSISTNGGNEGFPTVLPHPMDSGTDIRVSCDFISSNNTQLATHIQMVLIKNATG